MENANLEKYCQQFPIPFIVYANFTTPISQLLNLLIREKELRGLGFNLAHSAEESSASTFEWIAICGKQFGLWGDDWWLEALRRLTAIIGCQLGMVWEKYRLKGYAIEMIDRSCQISAPCQIWRAGLSIRSRNFRLTSIWARNRFERAQQF